MKASSAPDFVRSRPWLAPALVVAGGVLVILGRFHAKTPAAFGEPIWNGPPAFLAIEAMGVLILAAATLCLLVASPGTIAASVVAAIPLEQARWYGVSYLNLAFPVLAMRWIWLANTRRAPPVPVRFVRIAVAFLVVAAISAALSDHPALGLRRLVTLVGCLAFAYLVLSSRSDPDAGLLHPTYLAAASAAAIFAFAQAVFYLMGVHAWAVTEFTILNLNYPTLRVSGPFDAPPILAFFLIPALPIGVAWWSKAPGSRWRRAALAAGTFATIVCIGSLTRAAWVSFAALGYLLLLLGVWHLVRRPALKAIALLGLLAALVIAPAAWELAEGTNPGSPAIRLAIVRGGWIAFTEHPVIGNGPGTWVEPTWASEEERARAASLPGGANVVATSLKETHNTLLQVLVDVGFVGFALFVALVAVLVRDSLLGLARFQDRAVAALGAAAVLILVDATFDSYLYSKLLWVALAMTASVGAAAEKRSSRGRS